jgi:hypothetical protein
MGFPTNVFNNFSTKSGSEHFFTLQPKYRSDTVKKVTVLPWLAPTPLTQCALIVAHAEAAE